MNSVIAQRLNSAISFSLKAPLYWGWMLFLPILDISQKPDLAPVKWHFQRKATNQNLCSWSCTSDSVATRVVAKNRFAAVSLVPCIAVLSALASFSAHATAIELRAQLREHLKNPKFSLDRKQRRKDGK